MARELVLDCADKEGGTKADADFLLARNMPKDKIHKCINACVGESVGLVRILFFQFIFFIVTFLNLLQKNLVW